MRTIAEIADTIDAEQLVTFAEAEALVRSVERTCRGPMPAEAREIIARLIQDNMLDEARAMDSRVRTLCGQDINLLILAGPLDGEGHVAACPRCHMSIVYTAPRIRITPG